MSRVHKEKSQNAHRPQSVTTMVIKPETNNKKLTNYIYLKMKRNAFSSFLGLKHESIKTSWDMAKAVFKNILAKIHILLKEKKLKN